MSQSGQKESTTLDNPLQQEEDDILLLYHMYLIEGPNLALGIWLPVS